MVRKKFCSAVYNIRVKDEYQALGFSTDCHVFVGERVPDTPTFPTQRGDVTL